MKPQLSGAHRRTYDGVFRQPVAAGSAVGVVASRQEVVWRSGLIP